MSGIVFVVISIVMVARLYVLAGVEAAAGGLALAAVAATMVRFNEFWAEYILPFGFWASMASDSRNPGRSSAAVALLGWVLLILLAAASFFLPQAR